MLLNQQYSDAFEATKIDFDNADFYDSYVLWKLMTVHLMDHRVPNIPNIWSPQSATMTTSVNQDQPELN